MSTSIQEYSKTEAALATLRASYKGVVYTVTTRDGMKSAKEARAEIRTWRVELEKERKRIKEPALARCKEIDAEAKRITKELEALEDPIDAVIKLEEGKIEAERKLIEEAAAKAEAERVAKAEAAILDIKRCLFDMVGQSAKVIADQIKTIEAIDTLTYAFAVPAMQAKEETLVKLEELYAAAVKQEAERKRLAEEREAIAQEREQMAKRQAEQAPVMTPVVPPIVTADAYRLASACANVVAVNVQRLISARDSLQNFVITYGDLAELKPIIDAIKTYFEANNEH
jgi:hypothetical protein